MCNLRTKTMMESINVKVDEATLVSRLDDSSTSVVNNYDDVDFILPSINTLLLITLLILYLHLTIVVILLHCMIHSYRMKLRVHP